MLGVSGSPPIAGEMVAPLENYELLMSMAPLVPDDTQHLAWPNGSICLTQMLNSVVWGELDVM